ncbi:aminodeoxychorismate synthase component I [Gammaproteobacteria bacterium]|nr:aminodeoxychorismate synthase component I [Gammaproteobacteria bacterium]
MHKKKIKYYENSCVYGELLHKNDWFIFLDSCNDVGNYGRYDILSSNPRVKVTSNGNHINVIENNLTSSFYDNPLYILEKYYKIRKFDTDLPFNNGMIGYFGYEAFNLLPNNNKDNNDSEVFPDIAVGFYDWAIVVDHEKKETWVTFLDKNSIVDNIITKFSSENLKVKYNHNYNFSDFKQNISEEKYIDNVLKIKEYISSGDCYQVNYSQNFEVNYSGNAWDIYKDLRKINPAPYSSFFKLSDQFIISSSPERFISIKDSLIETKPIKGTLKRLIDKNLDHEQINILKNDEKNIAENLMIVDLLRNDLSKCCELHSVKVTKLFDIESYTSVHHMVSTVVGTLNPKTTSIDILKACFPGGSITGAPKKRAMEIISELENRKRGIYCGSVGYFDGNNNMDTNICIRTITLTENKISFAAGGGIVYDSDPRDEYHESLEKVSVFIKYFSNGEFKW